MAQWRVVTLDPAAARRASLPTRLAVPQDALPAAATAPTRTQAAEWARAYTSEADDEALLNELAPLIAKEPLWSRVESLLAEEAWPAVIDLLDQVLSIDPTDDAARLQRAAARIAAGQAREALVDLDAAAASGDWAAYHATRGRALEALDRSVEATAAYQRVLEHEPDNAFALGRLVALRVLVAAFDEQGRTVYIGAEDFARGVREDMTTHAGDAAYLISVAQVMLQTGHPELSLIGSEAALETAPQNADALLLAAVALAQLGRYPEALAYFDRHLAVDSDSVPGHASRAQVLLALGRRDDAVAAATHALTLDANELSATHLLVHAATDTPDAAARRANELAERYPAAWAPLRVAGDLALASDDRVGAISYWQQAVEAGADDATLGVLLGELGRDGRVDDVVELADSITRLAERDPGLRWNVAHGYAEAGRRDEARIVFAMIAHDPRVSADVRLAAEQRAADLSA